jgi:hypothetical protein
MTALVDPRLFAWQTFYVIVGSSGAALIGVQFVVITLIATIRRRTNAATVAAFATPTVVHLGAALLVSALMSAPWRSLAPPSVAVGTCGLAGLAYSAVVSLRARRQTGYKPVGEDWLWYAILPFVAHAALTTGALLMVTLTPIALDTIGAATLALLFVGIHNAWDAVTHMVVTRTDGNAIDPDTQGGPE